MAEFDGETQYYKAATRRLRDARALLQMPVTDTQESGAETRHLRAAIYIAGYAIECILKAHIISHSASARTLTEVLRLRRNRGETMPDLTGSDGHNLTLLLAVADLESDMKSDAARARDWNLCSQWKSTWRYDPEPPPLAFAQQFIEATARLHAWINLRV